MKIRSFVGLALLGAAGIACVCEYYKQKERVIDMMAGDCLNDCLCDREDFFAKQSGKLENNISDALKQGMDVKINSRILITPENCEQVVKDIELVTQGIVSGVEKFTAEQQEEEYFEEAPMPDDESTEAQEEMPTEEADEV